MIIPYKNKHPEIHRSVFVAEGAYIIGDVVIGEQSSVWYNSVIRGDVYYVRIGKRTSIQDLSACHCTKDTYPLIVGDGVTVGHRAVLHGCKIDDYCLIGMGAVILDDAHVGERCLVAAGAVISPGVKIPPRTLVMGVPAKPKRELNKAELESLEESAESYVELTKTYLEASKKKQDQ